MASPTGERLVKQVITHPSPGIALNSVLYVNGKIDAVPVQFLLDTGAAMSVVKWDVLPVQYRDKIVSIHPMVIGANCLPLEVSGQVVLPLSISHFNCADFLNSQAAIIDFNNKQLSLGTETRVDISILSSNENVRTCHGSTVQVTYGSVKEEPGNVTEGLFEPVDRGKLPKQVLAARSLSCVTTDKHVALQLMNTSPTPTKIYKGTILGVLVPSQHVLVLDQEKPSLTKSSADVTSLPDVNATCGHLSDTEKAQLTTLLTSYQDLFVLKTDLLGRTDKVKHSILTEGPPIRQPMR